MFVVNFVSFLIALVALNIHIASGNKISRTIFAIASGILFLTSTIIAFVRWPLYRGNKLRNRKNYRRNKH